MEYLPIEKPDVTIKLTEIADWVWEIAYRWEPFVRDTIGKQLTSALDSAPANLTEGGHRHTHADSLHFFVVARGSAEEGIFWLSRAITRGFMEPEAGQAKIAEVRAALRMLSKLIEYRRNLPKAVKERRAAYGDQGAPLWPNFQAD